MANVDPADPNNDITKEVGSIATLFQVNATDLPGAISACYDATKEEILEDIQSHIEDKFARNPSYVGLTYPQWWMNFGFTYLQTDNMPDYVRPIQIDGEDGAWTPDQITAAINAKKKITVATMTTTFAAYFIKRAFIKTSTNMKSSMNGAVKPFQSDIIIWTEEAKRRWKACQRRLWYDFYQVGTVTDPERGRIKGRTRRRG